MHQCLQVSIIVNNWHLVLAYISHLATPDKSTKGSLIDAKLFQGEIYEYQPKELQILLTKSFLFIDIWNMSDLVYYFIRDVHRYLSKRIHLK